MAEHQLFHITCKGLVFYKNRFLLHRASNPEFLGALECPGGRVDEGERFEDVLKRELREEAGLDMDILEHRTELFALNQRDAAEYGWDDKISIIEIYYKIVIPDHVDFELKALEEVSSFEWIDKNTNLDDFPYKVASRKDIYRMAQKSLE